MRKQAQEYSTPATSERASEKSDTYAGVVAGALKERGWSVHGWALDHCWASRSVYTVVERWVEHPERRGQMPLGGVSRAIIVSLHNELGADVVPLPDPSSRPVMERAA